MQRSKPLQNILGLQVVREDQTVLLDPAFPRYEFPHVENVLCTHIRPEEVELGMQRDLRLLAHGNSPFQVWILPIRRKGAQLVEKFFTVPFEAVSPRDQEMVVLGELTEWDQQFPDIEYLLDVSLDRFRLLERVHLDKVAILHDHDRPLDGIARCNRSGLAGPFDLDLGPYRDELVKEPHRRRVHAEGSEAGRPGPPVAQTKAPYSGWIGQHGPAHEHVLQELGAWRYLGSSVLDPFLLQVQILVDEIPAVYSQLLDVLLDLRGLET